jgi:hypothetical protein
MSKPESLVIFLKVNEGMDVNPFQSNFLPTAYSPALSGFGRERGWWITCNYPTVLKEKNIENQKEYNLALSVG